MKIFNIENNIKKLYIQKEDIINLMDINGFVLPSIYNKYKYSNIYNENPKEFIEITDLKEIDYLNKLDWIIDYREYVLMNENELIELGKHYETKINDIATTYNEMSLKERQQSYFLKREHDTLTYKFYQIIYMTRIKKGIDKLHTPLVIDYRGTIYSDESSDYVLESTINSNKFIIVRKDRKPMEKNEVPNDFYQEVVSKLALTRGTDEEFLNNEFTISEYYDNKNKCLVLKFEIEPPKYETIENPDLIVLKSDESNIKKLLKIFKKESNN